MINVDLQQLIQALDAETRRDLESSAERCVARGGNKILVEDLLLGLLERPHGLLARALQDAEVDAGELSAALQSRIEHSASRNPVFAPELVQWLQDALLVANLELGQSQVEQAALIRRRSIAVSDRRSITMELVFEILNTKQFVPTNLCQKTFKQAGGLIGRGEDCDWIIPDRKRHLSNHHALISYCEGAFFLTDTSSNGIQDSASGAHLRKGEALRIEHGSVYVLGDFEVRARLVRDPATFDVEAGRPQAAGRTIPDNAFLDLDPLNALDQQERVYSEIDELTALDAPRQEPKQRADYARIDMESLLVPALIDAPAEPAATPPPKAVERQSEGFWEHFGVALGMDLNGLDHDGREALALNAARLLKRSVGGLQQSLRTRSELKNELRLARTTVQGTHKNPLKFAVDASEALGMLLQPSTLGQLPAEQAISRAFHDLQAHQVALLTATRAAVRSTLEHFSPQQLTLRFERDNKPLIATSGSRWRAYGRYHHALRQDDDWSERLLARDFAQAYEEQIRLIAALHTDHQG